MEPTQVKQIMGLCTKWSCLQILDLDGCDWQCQTFWLATLHSWCTPVKYFLMRPFQCSHNLINSVHMLEIIKIKTLLYSLYVFSYDIKMIKLLNMVVFYWWKMIWRWVRMTTKIENDWQKLIFWAELQRWVSQIQVSVCCLKWWKSKSNFIKCWNNPQFWYHIVKPRLCTH